MSIATLLTHAGGHEHPARGGAARTQLAVVRALASELERRPPSGPSVSALRSQLVEELERMARILDTEPPTSDSGIFQRSSQSQATR